MVAVADFRPTNLIMDEGVLEDSYIDEKERMKLNSYNINKEKGIGTLQNFRWWLDMTGIAQ